MWMIRFLVSLAAISMPAAALADTRIAYVDEKSGAERTVITVKDGKVRMDNAEAENFSVYDSDSDVLTLVDPTRQSYTLLDDAKLRTLSGQMNDAMAKMRAQMAEMPPEQRAAMEKMMGGAANAGGRAPDIKLDRTGKQLNKGGHDCRQVFLTAGDLARMELCVVDQKRIEMPDGDRAALEAMQEQMRIVAESFAGSGKRAPLDYDSIGGMPVYMKSSSQRSGEVLKDVTHDDIDASLFEVPAGYREEKIAAAK